MSPTRRTRWRQELRALYLRAKDCPCFTALPCLKVVLPETPRPHVSGSVKHIVRLPMLCCFFQTSAELVGISPLPAPLLSPPASGRRETPVPPRAPTELMLPVSDIEVPLPGSPEQVSFLLTHSATQRLIISNGCRHRHLAASGAGQTRPFRICARTLLSSSVSFKLHHFRLFHFWLHLWRFHLLQLRSLRPQTALSRLHLTLSPQVKSFLTILLRRPSRKKSRWTQSRGISFLQWRGNITWHGPSRLTFPTLPTSWGGHPYYVNQTGCTWLQVRG